ncbi:MAG: very short patch repair endonuclease [Bacteroidia bacterium]|nr:very short patch repair endonuclease [Bacteroidia bacterium]
MDKVTKEVRSRNMSRIRSEDTTPELIVRRLIHRAGYRYRLHHRDLPGRPDLTFSSLKKAIFVHGCFWHRHSCSNGTVVPATRTEFWLEKFRTNVARDAAALQQLRLNGWTVLIVWECETRVGDHTQLQSRLIRFLES